MKKESVIAHTCCLRKAPNTLVVFLKTALYYLTLPDALGASIRGTLVACIVLQSGAIDMVMPQPALHPLYLHLCTGVSPLDPALLMKSREYF
jgi:hypothetical protein